MSIVPCCENKIRQCLHEKFMIYFTFYDRKTHIFILKTILSSLTSYIAVEIMDTMTGTNWHDRCPSQNLVAEYPTVMLKMKLRFTRR